MTQLGFSNPDCLRDLYMASEDDAPKYLPPDSIAIKFFGNGLPLSNGDKWRTHRKLATPAFNKALSPEIVGETVYEQFDFIQQHSSGHIDLFELMQRTTIEVFGKLAFGYQFGAKSGRRLVFPLLNKLPTEENRKFFKAIDEFDEFIYDIIMEKRNAIENKKGSENGRIDLVTSMIELSNREGISTDLKQLRDEMANFFVAGHDTTSMGLNTSFYFLAKYPEMQERARKEVIKILGNEPIIPTSEQLEKMKYLIAIIKESLRIYPPATLIIPRKLAKPLKIGSHVVPANVICSANLWQIHHNPKYWKNPKQYNPDRFLNGEKIHPFSWIPFSTGPRNWHVPLLINNSFNVPLSHQLISFKFCSIGQNFTLMEQKVILSMCLLKYKWTLPENSIHKEKLMLEPSFLLRPIDLKIVFTERNS
ncbi:6225_t:CDS:2 [Funneliformis caledonium]|uniref:6225_t:CDS:1 n=1 Tax=Funneliformis caledonium TaxID=1117310 RepID=A0A9N9H328_9GLOM|nr:6225_t:CDS:2 [Funneliformis caledonium]